MAFKSVTVADDSVIKDKTSAISWACQSTKTLSWVEQSKSKILLTWKQIRQGLLLMDTFLSVCCETNIFYGCFQLH